MNAAQQLHQAGQSLWLDAISRRLLTSGRIAHYIDALALTGRTSNPTILETSLVKDLNRSTTCLWTVEISTVIR